MEVNEISVFIGVDVGKSEHWACALDPEGHVLFDKSLPNDESKLRALFDRLGKPDRLLVVVDQPATIGALVVAVAQAMGIPVGYLPGLSMRRITDPAPGRTDRRDAPVIAHAARTIPDTLQSLRDHARTDRFIDSDHHKVPEMSVLRAALRCAKVNI